MKSVWLILVFLCLQLLPAPFSSFFVHGLSSSNGPQRQGPLPLPSEESSPRRTQGRRGSSRGRSAGGRGDERMISNNSNLDRSPIPRDGVAGLRQERSRVQNNNRTSGPSRRRRQEEQQQQPTSSRDDIVVLFDPKKLTSQQIPNEDAQALNLFHVTNRYDPTVGEGFDSVESNWTKREAKYNKTVDLLSRRLALLFCVSTPTFIRRKCENCIDTSSNVLSDEDVLDDECKGSKVEHLHFEYLSLDDLFSNLNFGHHFYTNGKFRNDIRNAMRRDIFFTTPAYANLSPKVASMMLDDDSSLQGSWNCIPKNVLNKDMMESSIPLVRMTRLSKVLKETLGSEAPTGDEFMMKLGQLCGVHPSNHWIDIIGIKDRRISHSWHQDTGVSTFDANDVNVETSSRFTVMLGFPLEDEYTGCGVFSHVIKLEYQHLAPKGHNVNEPVLFEGTVDERFIVRPIFTLGKEIIRYRDIDVVHSAPDVTYRQSVMRFM